MEHLELPVEGGSLRGDGCVGVDDDALGLLRGVLSTTPTCPAPRRGGGGGCRALVHHRAEVVGEAAGSHRRPLPGQVWFDAFRLGRGGEGRGDNINLQSPQCYKNTLVVVI